jgi:hypothetical protein
VSTDVVADAAAPVACVPRPEDHGRRYVHSFHLTTCDPGDGLCGGTHPLQVDVELARFDGVGWLADPEEALQSIAFNIGHAAARAAPDNVVRGAVDITVVDGARPSARPHGNATLPADMVDRLSNGYWRMLGVCGAPDRGSVLLVVPFTVRSRPSR